MRKILITGADSYIGMSVEKWLSKNPDKYQVNTLDMIGNAWKDYDFSEYDVVFHVAGIAHRKETKKNAHLYYEVNQNLAIQVAEKSKKEGIKQFIILSSMSVYGMETGYITKETKPNPKTHYGISKYNADLKIEELADDNFKVAILRPPMVYGKGCKGNYQTLRKVALKSPIFPDIKNQRSMVYIDNLAEFVKRIIDDGATGLFFPQDAEYVCTADMVRKIAVCNDKGIIFIKLFTPLIIMGKNIGNTLLNKVFGSLVYERCDIVDIASFDEIIKKIELHSKGENCK